VLLRKNKRIKYYYETCNIYLFYSSYKQLEVDLGEIGWEGCIHWITLAQDRDKWRALVNGVRVPQNAGGFLSDCAIGGLSSRAQFHIVSYRHLECGALL
jgi:hypothetical protein